jgi:hypothetical protein
VSLQFTEPEDFITSVVTQTTIRQPFWFIVWVSLENHDPNPKILNIKKTCQFAWQFAASKSSSLFELVWHSESHVQEQY